MTLANSKIVPAAFWVGFLALGFATSLGAPGKHRVDQASKTVKTSLAPKAVVAQSDRPLDAKAEIKAAARD
ncbi:hypothetical protein [Methylocystis sp. S23]|jgi:hypothetical protein